MAIISRKFFISAILLSIACGLNHFDLQGSESNESKNHPTLRKRSNTLRENHPTLHKLIVAGAVVSGALFTYQAIKDNPKYFVLAALSAATAIGSLPQDWVFGTVNTKPSMPDELKNHKITTMIPKNIPDPMTLNLKTGAKYHSQYHVQVLQWYKKLIYDVGLGKRINEYNNTVTAYNRKLLNYHCGKSTLLYRILCELIPELCVEGHIQAFSSYSGSLARLYSLHSIAWQMRCFFSDQEIDDFFYGKKKDGKNDDEAEKDDEAEEDDETEEEKKNKPSLKQQQQKLFTSMVNQECFGSKNPHYYIYFEKIHGDFHAMSQVAKKIYNPAGKTSNGNLMGSYETDILKLECYKNL